MNFDVLVTSPRGYSWGIGKRANYHRHHVYHNRTFDMLLINIPSSIFEAHYKSRELFTFSCFFFWLQIIFDCKFMPNFKVVTNRLSPIIANNLVSLDDLKPHSDKALSFICQLFGTPTAINSPESGAFIMAQCLLSFRFHFCSCLFLNFYQGFRFLVMCFEYIFGARICSNLEGNDCHTVQCP